MNSHGSAATQIYSKKFDQRFFDLPKSLQERVQKQIDDLGMALRSHSHQRLQGTEVFKLRVGDFRIIYEFNVERNELYLITLGHRRDIYKKAFN